MSSSTDLVVIGLGYVGLPLVAEACRSGLKVTGYDINSDVIEKLQSGRSYIDDLADDDVQSMLKAGFTPTSDPSCLSNTGAVAICVPTPLSPRGGPDLTALLAAASTLSEHLHPGTLVVVESTTYPGSTEEDVMPILESSGLRAGEDFHLAFSPERIDPGNARFGVRNTPKVVGGFTAECTRRAVSLYSQFVDTVVQARGTREAEMAKLLENTYRHVNIALVNEMAKFSNELGIDIWDVIECAASKPFGYQAFYPGPGVGGHCIPIDPNYLSYKVHVELGYRFRFVELAQDINSSMPAYIVQRTQAILNESKIALNGAHIMLLGVTYKKDIADQRESPAVEVAKRFSAGGAKVSYHDPYIAEWRVGDEQLTSAADPVAAARLADVVVLLQPHSAYADNHIAMAAVRFFDTRSNKTAYGTSL